MGYFPLRREIAGYLMRWRGVIADPRQVLITSGAAQGLSLLKTFCPAVRLGYMIIPNTYQSGLHLILRFPEGYLTDNIIKRLEASNINIKLINDYYYPKKYNKNFNSLVIGFGNVSESKIIEGIRSLHTVLNK